MTRATITRKLRITDPGALPLWLQGKPVHEWVAVPAPAGRTSSAIEHAEDWSNYTPSMKGVNDNTGLFNDSGATLKASGSELFIIGGGHRDYSGNEVFSIRLGDDAPVWQRRADPSPDTMIPWNSMQDATSAYYNDGRPASRHTYFNLQFIDERNLVVMFGCYGTFSVAANSFSNVDAFDPVTNEYISGFSSASAIGTWGSGVTKAGNGDVYMFRENSGLIRRWNQATNTFTDVATRGAYSAETGFACDTTRNRVFRMPRIAYGSYVALPAALYDLNNNAAQTTPPLTGYSPTPAATRGAGSVIYCPVADAYFAMVWGQPTIWKIDAATFVATAINPGGDAPNMNYDPGSDGHGRFYGRYTYAPELRAIVLALRTTDSVRVMRTA